MKIGIEKLSLYAGRFCTDAIELAIARGKERKYAADQVMVGERAVIPVFEDAVTLAINAARPLLSPEDAKSVELLIVNTESAVDFGKPVSTWVHRFCELSPNCRNFELKHACYGGTGALKMAALWVASGVRPGKKALVVSADFTRPHVGDGFDFVGGGGAVAMLIGADPQLLEFEVDKAGYWTHEISDAFRPTATVEQVDNQTSLYSYLDALDGAFNHYTQIVGPVDYPSRFKKHIYHTPFPGMALQAHRAMMRNFDVQKAAIEKSFQAKVLEGLHFARRIGTAYGASNFVSLLSLLTTAKDLAAGDVISLFSYGSGCQGEFYHGSVGPGALGLARSLDLDRALDERVALPIDVYELNERLRKSFADRPDYEPMRTGEPAYDALYEEHYAKRGLLVLKQVKGYHRTYEPS
jgi:hydroxymethylglutaryl-CoA synthase